MATISCSSSPSSLLFGPVRTLAAPLPPASVSFPPLSHHRGWTRQVKIGASRGVAVVVKAVAEEETEGAVVATSEETVAVPVSPSDLLLMYFKAEGTMEDAAIPSIEKALEAQDGIYDLEVSNSEGVGSVVLTKETTVQATGVASYLVELIQGAGFKLHTLSLSFEDEEDEISEAAIELEDEE